MKISSIEVFPVELPLVREHKMAYSRGESIGKFSLVKVITNDGIIGWGEAPTEINWGGDYGSYYGESQKTTLHIIKDFLEPELKGENPFQPAIDLWEMGYVPSFDGKTWRLHAGKDARIVWEAENE